jgi:amino acid transporter
MATEAKAQPAAGGLYLRKATGLVREISMGEALIYNVLPAVPGLILAWSFFWIIGAFPGVSMIGGMVIAAVLAVGIAVAFGLLAAAMPRTGGDYVLVSRTLHPALGMISSISLMFSGFLSIGYWAWSWTFFGISPGLKILGATSGSQGLIGLGNTLGQPVSALVIGVLSIILISVVLARGMRTTMTMQNWAWWVATGGLALMALILLFTGRAGFMARFNAFAQPYTGQADSYNYFIQAALANGFTWTGKYLFGPTLAAVGGFLTFGMWTFWSVHMSGEIKGGATRQQMWTMVGAALIQYGIFILMALLMFKTIGEQFIGAITFLGSNAEIYTLPAPPVITMLVSIIPGGWLIPFLIVVAFLGWIPLVHFIQFIQPIRAFFAMAFDRVLPAKLADVDERTHAPIVGLIVCAVIGLICLVWAVFSPTFMTVIVIAGLFGVPPIALVGISAIVFPWRLKELYNSSPAKVEFLGIPVVSIAGLVAVLAEVLYTYVVFKFGLLPPPQQGLGLIITGAVIVVSAAIYYIAYFIRKSQGIDLRLLFKELPPE